jgi:hypothetical protein
MGILKAHKVTRQLRNLSIAPRNIFGLLHVFQARRLVVFYISAFGFVVERECESSSSSIVFGASISSIMNLFVS